MSDRNRSVLALVLACSLALAAFAASGCALKSPAPGGQTAAEPKKGGTLKVYIANPAYIDPYNLKDADGALIGTALFRSLTAFDVLDPAKVIPAAAEKWETNADATVWTFYLNKNGKFSDGTPVTAQDFIYAWSRIAAPNTINTATRKVDASTLSYHLEPIKGTDDQGQAENGISGLKAIDDHTLQVTLKYGFGDFEYVVGHPALAPVPRKYVENGVDYNGTKAAFSDMPIGNGPFKMAEPWKHGQSVKVVRNDAFDGAKPYVDGIDFMQYKDPATAYLDFQAGNLDFAQVPAGKIKEAVSKYGQSDNGYTSNPQKQVMLGAENAIYYLDMNNDDPAYKNKDLRRAISLAINRQAICDVSYQGTRDPADNVVPPGIAGYVKGAWADSRYDKAAAEKALEAAGFPGGKGAPEISLQYNSDGDHQKNMELIQADLSAIGLKVKLAGTPDFATFQKMMESGKGQVSRDGWSSDYPIMDNFLFPLFFSKGMNNYSHYKNLAVDKGIEDARKVPDAVARLKAYNEVNKMIAADMPVIPLVFYKHNWVGSERVHELTYSAMNLIDYSKCWITPGTAAK